MVSDGNVGVLGAQDALSTPFNITTYTAQLILDQQSETIGEVLENDPAVRTTFGSGQPVRTVRHPRLRAVRR
ncbi:MAG: hypothetical protein JWM65_2772 [Sphingomonas bacterium]|nr:hypothetical protein [Sphingomonas bacterium]